MPFTSMASSATITPRIEMYTMLACSVHKPDIFRQNFPGVELGLQSFAVSDVKALNLSAPNTSPVIEIPVHLPQVPATNTDADDRDEPAPDPPKRGNQCASDPVVQAAVAKLTAGACVRFFLCCVRCKPRIVAWMRGGQPHFLRHPPTLRAL